MMRKGFSGSAPAAQGADYAGAARSEAFERERLHRSIRLMFDCGPTKRHGGFLQPDLKLR
jgi:hypothetical protein